MKRLPFLLALLSVFPVGRAFGEELPALVARTLSQQPGVQSAQALLRAAEAQIVQTRSEFLPTASATYRNADARDETQGLPVQRTIRRSDASLRWNVFNGGADWHRVVSSNRSRDAAEADLESTLEKLAAEIAENYADVARLRLSVSALQGLIARQEALASRVAQRVEAGRIPPTEQDLLRSRQIQNQSLLGQLRSQLAVAEYRYQLLNGEAPSHQNLPGLTELGEELPMDPVLDHVLTANTRLRAARERANARDAEINVALGAFAPTVDLQFSKRLNNDTTPVPVTDTNRSQQVQLNLDIPLGGRNLGRLTEARERHKAALADYEQARQDIAREARELHAQWMAEREIASAQEQRVLAAQRVASGYELHFEAGRRSLNDLANALDDVFDAQRSLLDNRARLAVLHARLLSLSNDLRGALTERYRPVTLDAALLSFPPSVASHVFSPSPNASDSPSSLPADGNDVRRQLESWRADWQMQDADAYLRHYSPTFRPDGDGDRRSWENTRRQRITRARSPKIEIDGLRIDTIDPQQVRLRFTQRYQAAHYTDVVEKQMLWVKEGDHWRIRSESVIATSPQ